MTALKVEIPTTVDVTELEEEIVTALGERLRDDHGYKLAEAHKCRRRRRQQLSVAARGEHRGGEGDDLIRPFRAASDVDAAELVHRHQQHPSAAT